MPSSKAPPTATRNSATSPTASPPRGCRRTCILARSRRGRWWRAYWRNAGRRPCSPTSTTSSVNWAGASSATTCCSTFRTRRGKTSIPNSGSSAGPNPSPVTWPPGSAAAPACRSWTQACANSGPPAGCTTACAWWWRVSSPRTCATTGNTAPTGSGTRWWTPTWPTTPGLAVDRRHGGRRRALLPYLQSHRPGGEVRPGRQVHQTLAAGAGEPARVRTGGALGAARTAAPARARLSAPAHHRPQGQPRCRAGRLLRHQGLSTAPALTPPSRRRHSGR